jgi:beta-mannosidase
MRIVLSICFLFLNLNLFAQTITLKANWTYKHADSSTWRKTGFTSTIHTSLLNDKLIPDPFYRDNEYKLQWIADQNWEYATQFDVKPNYKTFSNVLLKFEGLDTYTDIFLNDVKILSTDNMFRTYTIDVKSWLKIKNNKLRIVFYSVKKITDSLAKQSNVVRPCENNRNYVRKAQYNFGWDWAPRLITCGVWRPVKLIYGKDAMPATARYAPVKFVQENDSIGQSFYFTVNGKPTFMKGANWIPADVFLPRLTKQRYRQLLLAAKEAHFNMLRVWGGGIYEDDVFYDLCDSLGIYVWQDFMFAGAMYPGDSSFLENVKQEVTDNILRLRKHKCIVLWCGNNEIDEAWHNWGWKEQFHLTSADSTKLWNDYRILFHELIPSLVKQYDSGRQYIASSPLYGWGRQQSMTHGDSHYWGMWWGMDSISMMSKKIPRFMSEYGMQAMPGIESIRRFATNADMDTSSVVMKIHQKHPTGFKTLNNYLQMEKIPVTDFASFIAATQELQCRALKTAIYAQRHSEGRCMGSLLWQFNDCWPVCSWSIVDYYGRKKKGYETVKKLYR